ncbi:ABC transporter permease [Pseudobutyrivibrio ruminis]|uniref:Putative ABC transport system permease protein n=1 Tax=Pseudobutyrivibrio ruminis DSM 9787 TaxID=1123011 RepID=A0A285S3J5_9FIRM|nr:ABC transporter permease [Pseudobutyrivibrio ruminis]SOC01198.1 putative ABC transport system permease protein [Pseudobutyrivibrio ruminis DSM 9787]
MLAKSSFREIKETIGRYIALVLIIALGVGFFSGLKVTDPAMRQAMQQYFKDTSFYDYRLISTLGFEEEDVEYVAENVSARDVEGSVSFDVLADYADSSHAIKAISIPTNVNTIVLESGRLPESDDECLVDSYLFDESTIGNTIKISSNNEKEDRENFKYSQYTIVGTVKSPLYIQYERGGTTLGSGVLDGFIYINKGGFDVEYYTDIYVKLDSDLEIYSDEYKDLIDEKEDEVQAALDEAADNRYDRIIADAYNELNDAKEEFETSKADGATELADAKEELDSAKKQLDSAKAQIEEYEAQESQLKAMLDMLLLDPNQQAAAGELSVQLYTLQVGLETAKTEYANGLAEYNDGLAEYEEGLEEYNTKIADAEAEIADAEAEIEDIEEANTYLLMRDSNVGYVCFESDSTIVGAIANVFPVFFFLVAALVFMTTMNRMVEDQRTQIGVLKALGYSNGSIMGKFVFYSGSAAFIGTALGFIAGTIAFPKAIWFAYKMMYNTSEITYYYSPTMLLISFVVAFVCSVGVTFISCRYEMGEMAASLMRPKAPKAGKRIFLEYLPWFWNRLKFLKKVSLRNIFRYKGRLFMMVLGIGGCTALLVAGFGIYDSIADIAVNQFTNISKYDMDITLKDGAKDTVAPLENMGYTVDDYLLYYHTSVDLKAGKHTKNVYLNVYDNDANIDYFYDMHDGSDEHIVFADLKDDEIIVNKGLSERYGIKIGDKVTISSDSMNATTFKVAAINENFIYNYVYLTTSGYETNIGTLPEKKNVYLNIKEDEDAHSVGAELMNNKSISVVSATIDTLDRVDSMMKSLNIIVYLVIGSAMALAAVVVYNLTNINIAERVREIATVKVLGFYKEETSAYVFRENILLAIMGAAVGLVLGKFLHAFVMSEIVVDLITFDVRVTAFSYILAFVLTVLFTFIINLLMGKKLDEISMTESLKAVE